MSTRGTYVGDAHKGSFRAVLVPNLTCYFIRIFKFSASHYHNSYITGYKDCRKTCMSQHKYDFLTLKAPFSEYTLTGDRYVLIPGTLSTKDTAELSLSSVADSPAREQVRALVLVTSIVCHLYR